jgi:hypothetical protein
LTDLRAFVARDFGQLAIIGVVVLALVVYLSVVRSATDPGERDNWRR